MSRLTPELLLLSCSVPNGTMHHGAPRVRVTLLFMESAGTREAICGQRVILRGLPYEPQPYATKLPRTRGSWQTGAGVGAAFWDQDASLQHPHATLSPSPPGRLDLPRSATWHPGPVLR